MPETVPGTVSGRREGERTPTFKETAGTTKGEESKQRTTWFCGDIGSAVEGPGLALGDIGSGVEGPGLALREGTWRGGAALS